MHYASEYTQRSTVVGIVIVLALLFSTGCEILPPLPEVDEKPLIKSPGMEILVVEEDGPDSAKYTLFVDVYDSIPSQRIAGLPNALLVMDSDTFDVYDLQSFSQDNEGLRRVKIPDRVSLMISGSDEYTTILESHTRAFGITGPDSLSRSNTYLRVSFTPWITGGEWIACVVFQRDPTDNTWFKVSQAGRGSWKDSDIDVYAKDFLRFTRPGETIRVRLTRTSPMVRSSDFPGGSVGTYRATRIHPVVIW